MPDQLFSLLELLGPQPFGRPPLRTLQLELQGQRLSHPIGLEDRPDNMRSRIIRTHHHSHPEQVLGQVAPILRTNAKAADAVKRTSSEYCKCGQKSRRPARSIGKIASAYGVLRRSRQSWPLVARPAFGPPIRDPPAPCLLAGLAGGEICVCWRAEPAGLSPGAKS